MTPPINLPDGSEVSEVILPDGASASEVIAPDGSTVLSAIPDGEEFHYKFGANGLTDSSGNGNDLSGDSALVTKDGRDAYDVTGSNSATSSYSASNFSNSAFSFGLWFYTESLTADNDHFYYIENNYVIYRIFNGGFEIFFGPANGTDLVGVISTQTNTWVHAFLTYDGNSTGRVYRDGQKIEEASNLNDIQNRQNSTSIGGDPVGKPLTDTAFVDDVMLFERELSATEVNDIFNAQK